MGLKLYQHKDNRDVAVQVLKMIRIEGKDYARIKVVWWNIGPHEPFCMNIIQMLTDSSIKGGMKQRTKYPLSKWRREWSTLNKNVHVQA